MPVDCRLDQLVAGCLGADLVDPDAVALEAPA
jgi:hypothetical protein